MPRMRSNRLTIAIALVIAVCVFATDVLTALHGAVAVLYTTVILLVARTSDRRALRATGLFCAALTVLGWVNMHWGKDFDSASVRLIVSLTAIAVTTALAERNNTSRQALSEQARILDLTHDAVIIRSRDDIILYWNEGAEKLYGWSRDEAIGRDAQSLLATEVDRSARIAVEDTGRWVGEVTRVRKDGERIALASRWISRLDRTGTATGVIETSADLTQARHESEERRRSEERYHAIFNAAGFPIWETDLAILLDALPGEEEASGYDAGRIASQARVGNANDAAAALFGLRSRDDLIGRSTVAFYPPEQAPALRRIWAGLHQGQSPVEQETQIVAADGSRTDILLRVTLPEGENAWRRVLVMAVDITERNRSRARLEQAQAELAHVTRITLLGQLAASIAHEVNQPLSAIITYAKSGKRWLRQEAGQAPEVENCLEHIVSNGVRAAEVISRVRAMARKSNPHYGPVDLIDLLGETTELLHRDLQSHQVTVNISKPDGLPAVCGDRVQIQQVVMNLMLNAEQAMAANPPQDRAICIDLEIHSQTVAIEVRDCGSGIDGDPEHLFRPFFTTKLTGMGMGLSICRSIVEHHGGTLTAANADDRGAAFRFTLPIARALMEVAV